LLIIELENAESLDVVALLDGGLLLFSEEEEENSPEVAPSLSSKLGTVLMVEAMRVGTCGWCTCCGWCGCACPGDDVVVRGCLVGLVGGSAFTGLAAFGTVGGIGFEFTVAGEAGDRLVRDVFRPCSNPLSLCLVGVDLGELVLRSCAGPEGGWVTKRPLRNIVSIGF
jgi:hypothetical protein